MLLTHLQALVKDLSKPHVLSDGLAIYRRLQSDDQDSVRLLTVEDLVAIAQQLTPAEVHEQLLKQIRQTMTDKSWRVRYMAASHFNEVVSYVLLSSGERSTRSSSLTLLAPSSSGRSLWRISWPFSKTMRQKSEQLLRAKFQVRRSIADICHQIKQCT